MRNHLLGAAGVAIIGVMGLSACDMLGMNSEKKDEAAAEGGSTEDGGAAAGAAEEESSGKPDDEGAGGGSASSGEGGGSGGDPAAGKPDDEGSGGSGSGSGSGSSGGPSGDRGGSGGGSAGGGGGGVRTVGDVPAEFAQLMDRYLDYYVENMGQGTGPSGVQDVVTGLRAGSEYRWNVGTLRGGQTYAFFGACDDDCSDVDIIVEDENGIEVGSDTLVDDYPVVVITPRYDGPFTARILLVNCQIEPCYVGGRVVQQR